MKSILSLIFNTTSYDVLHILTYSVFLCDKLLLLPFLRSVVGCGKHAKHWKRFYTFSIFIYMKLTGLMNLDLSWLRLHSFSEMSGVSKVKRQKWMKDLIPSFCVKMAVFSLFFNVPVSYWWGFLNYTKKESQMLSTLKKETVNCTSWKGRYLCCSHVHVYFSAKGCVLFLRCNKLQVWFACLRRLCEDCVWSRRCMPALMLQTLFLLTLTNIPLHLWTASGVTQGPFSCQVVYHLCDWHCWCVCLCLDGYHRVCCEPGCV